MTHPPSTYARTPAMNNDLVSIQFSTATWIVIMATLKGWHVPGGTAQNRHWAADHIARKLLEEHGYAEPDQR